MVSGCGQDSNIPSPKKLESYRNTNKTVIQLQESLKAKATSRSWATVIWQFLSAVTRWIQSITSPPMTRRKTLRTFTNIP
jgi:hypothetical protein